MMSLLHHPPDPSTPTVATDLEGTLTAGTTWKGMYNYLLQHGYARQARGFYLTHLPGYLSHKLLGGDFGKFKNAWMRDLLHVFKGFSTQKFADMCLWVVENEIWPQRRKQVVTELDAHLKAGRRVLVVTGMYEPLLEQLIRKLPGLEALATPVQWDNGHFSGMRTDDFNTGERKRQNLHPFAQNGKIYAAYGDTFPDVPMLEMSEHPVAVHPDPQLRAAALARGWRILMGEDGRI
ncbi:MAG: haloacid dehalogenase-like hydrolase [Anaerolineales bacterium]|nr:haloacid dehalogenase-like hydrolase [Anaerolineales bacterium]